MKCYVIENKEGRYRTEYDDGCTDLRYANMFDEEDKQYEKLYDDEYWQEITLAEGDLEKELEVYKRALELACEDLETFEIKPSGIKIHCYIYLARKELEEKDD